MDSQSTFYSLGAWLEALLPPAAPASRGLSSDHTLCSSEYAASPTFQFCLLQGVAKRPLLYEAMI